MKIRPIILIAYIIILTCLSLFLIFLTSPLVNKLFGLTLLMFAVILICGGWLNNLSEQLEDLKKWTTDSFLLFSDMQENHTRGIIDLGTSLLALTKVVKEVAEIAEIDSEALKELNEKRAKQNQPPLAEKDIENTILTLEKRGEELSKKASNDEFIALERLVKNKMLPELKAMGFHFKFLLWFMPIVLTIIGILIAIEKIQLRTP